MLKAVISLFFLLASSSLMAAESETKTSEGADHKVRLQTHFHKPLTDTGWGVGGWVVLPDLIGQTTSTLFLIGPRYEGDGWWMEGLAGGLMTPVDPVAHPWVLSGRFEFMPSALNGPFRIWGNIQLNDVTGEAFQPSALFMFDYALMDEKIFLGIETENHINVPVVAWNGEITGKTINDFSIGPQMMLPFGGLTITTAFQFHPEESVRHQYWLRVMYDFGPVSG